MVGLYDVNSWNLHFIYNKTVLAKILIQSSLLKWWIVIHHLNALINFNAWIKSYSNFTLTLFHFVMVTSKIPQKNLMDHCCLLLFSMNFYIEENIIKTLLKLACKIIYKKERRKKKSGLSSTSVTLKKKKISLKYPALKSWEHNEQTTQQSLIQ